MSIAQEKMRRLAHRGINVLGRVKERSAVLSAFAETFLPIAERYIDLYDAGRTLRQANRREGAEGRDAIDTLAGATRSWSGPRPRPPRSAGSTRSRPRGSLGWSGSRKRRGKAGSSFGRRQTPTNAD